MEVISSITCGVIASYVIVKISYKLGMKHGRQNLALHLASDLTDAILVGLWLDVIDVRDRCRAIRDGKE